MRHAFGLGTALISVALVLAGCGSSAATPAATAGPAGSTAAAGATAAAPGGTKAPAGRKVADACGLISAAEAGGVMGAALTPAATGDGASFLYCSYSSAADMLIYTSYMTAGATAVYNAYATGADAIKVSGIGDGAVYVPGSRVFFVLKGDTAAGISITSKLPQDQQIELLKKLGAFAAGRM